MPGPIKPQDVVKKKIPEVVFEVANELIAEKWNGSSATFTLTELVKRVVDRVATGDSTKAAVKADLFEKHAFDIEESYRVAGWKVDFETSAYCETFPAKYTFSKRRKND